jgi:pimeloyl-ACP methyl ester carboxylesterase
MSFVEANGLTFHVQELGEGPPVAMIHGMFLGNLASWYFSVAPVLAADRRVFMYDLRGHGKSEKATTGYDLATLVADLHALVARFGDRPLDLVGHSYGGLVALRFALGHPERVRRLAVVEAPFPPHQIEENRAVLGLDPDDMLKLTDPETLRGSIAESGHDPDALLDRLLPPGMKETVLGSKRRLRSFFRGLHFLTTETTIGEDVKRESDLTADSLASIGCPVLCVYGETSSCRVGGDRLVAALPAAELRIMPCGHYILGERPLELAAILKEFLHG